MIGKRLGSYQIIEQLGAGGMGKVYAAEHTMIGRRAAIKVLLSRYSREKEITERFFREAKAAAKIHHAGIVDIFDYGWTDDGSAYIMMELLEGESLRDRIQRVGCMSDEETLRLSRQMANALAAAHATGIVHRDLKPDNVFVIRDAEVPGGERVKLLDFGIAKVTDELGNSVSKTSTGMILGSPLYMSPEQCTGNKEVDLRADVYALGCVMYHMICGRPPFVGSGSGKIIAQHIYEAPRPPSCYQAAVRPVVEAIIIRALLKEPHDRFQNMVEFEQALVNAGAASFAGSRPGTSPVIGRSVPPTVEIDRSSGIIATQQPRAASYTGPTGSMAARPSTSMSAVQPVLSEPHSAPLQAPPQLSNPPEYLYPSPTTLGSVASQITGESRRRRGRARLWLALGFLAVAAGGSVAAWQWSSATGGAVTTRGQGAAVATTATEPEPEPAAPAPKIDPAAAPSVAPGGEVPSAPPGGDRAQPDPDTAPDSKPHSDAEPAPEADTITVRIVSTRPRRASVRDVTMNLLGQTPLSLDVPRDGKVLTFTVSRDGYRDETIELRADRNQTRRLKLRKERRSSPDGSGKPQGPDEPPPATDPPQPDPPIADPDEDDEGQKDDSFGNTTNPFED